MNEYLLKDLFEKPISGIWGKELSEGKKGVKVLRTTNFTSDGTVNFQDVVERDIELIDEKKVLQKGDIIIEKSGGGPGQPVGRVVFFDKDCSKEEIYVCNNFTAILRPKKGFNSKYLLYTLINLYNHGVVFKFQNNTTGIRNLKLNDYLNSTKVIIPDLDIQHKIVQVLDKAQSLIDKRKEQIKQCDELIQSLFYDMFGDPIINPKGWKSISLGNISNLKTGGTPSRSNPKFFEGNIPWITTVALGKTYIDDKDAIEFITEEAINNSSTKLIKENSLLLGVRVGVGKVSINTVPMCTNQDIVSISDIDESKFDLVFVLNVIRAYSKYFNNQKRGATIKGIEIDTVKKIKIPMPDICLQRCYSNIVSNIEHQKQLLQQSLSLLEDNFNSLMQKAFKGELFQ